MADIANIELEEKPVTLYGNKICPFAHNSYLAIEEVGVPYEFKTIELGPNKPASYYEVNPRGTVPTLVHGEKTILESLLITKYISKAFNGTLIPEDPEQAFQVDLFIEDHKPFIRPMYGLLKNQDPSKDAGFIATIDAALDKLEARLGEGPEGPWVNGEQFTIAETTILPFLDRFRHTLAYYRGYTVLSESRPLIGAWLAALEGRESFQKTAGTAEFYIDIYSYYAGERGQSTPGAAAERKEEAAPAEGSGLVLYGNPICPFAHNAHLAISEVGVDYEFKFITLGKDKPDSYYEINPRGTVPTLIDGDQTILESLLITKYLSNKFGGTLVPSDPLDSYRVDLFIEDSKAAIGPMYRLLKNQDPEQDATMMETVDGLLDKLEARLVEHGDGPFLLGQQFSIAETTILPFIDRFRFTLAHYRGYTVLSESRPRLAAWMAALEERESYKKTAPGAEYYIEKYTGYAGERGQSGQPAAADAE